MINIYPFDNTNKNIMPTYDYGCTSCEHTFDKLLPVDNRYAPLDEPCPNCGAVGQMHLLMGAPVVHWSFMGSTVQNKAPEGFKDILRNIKNSKGGNTPGIEL